MYSYSSRLCCECLPNPKCVPPRYRKIYLGMDPDTDEDFLWIAKEALFAAVPEVSGDNNIRRSAIYTYINIPMF